MSTFLRADPSDREVREEETLRDNFFSLVRASKEWKVHEVLIFPRRQNRNGKLIDWAALAGIAGTGHIGTVHFRFYEKRAKKEDVKAVWEIAEKFKFFDGIFREIGGGRAKEEDPKTSWEEAYENHLHQIC